MLEQILAGMEFENPTGDGWLYKEASAMRKLVKLGIENFNMFEKAMFLHNKPIVEVVNTKDVIKFGEAYGRLAMENTSLPAGAPNQGFLVVALDPLEKIPDGDRLDNVFVQFVNLKIDETTQPIRQKNCEVIDISGKGRLK